MELSIIVPIYNEEQTIPELYERLTNAAKQITNDYELVFVNDGSRDKSLFSLISLSHSDSHVVYINFSRNFGHQIAVTAGIDACKGDAVVIIDGDLQDPPELIPEMYAKHKEGYEVVYAQRKEREGETYFKKVTAKVFYRILKKSTSINIPVDTGDFRLIDRKVVNCLKEMPEQNKFLRGQISWIGFRQTAVLFNREKRKYGTTGYSFNKMLSFAIDGITGFSDKPLQCITFSGILFIAFSFLLFLYAVIKYFSFVGNISGWFIAIICMTFVGGVQLVALGIVGEYISRINKNILKRPIYIIESSNVKSEK